MHVWQIDICSVSGSKILRPNLNFPSRGQRIYSKSTLAFFGNKMKQTELKTSVFLPPSKQLLCEIYILNVWLRKPSRYDWQKKTHIFLNTVHPLDRDFWFTNTVTLPIYSLWHLLMLRHPYPFILFGRLVMKPHHYPLIPCASCSGKLRFDMVYIYIYIYTYCIF